jgi:hypothetical protein
VDGIQLRNKGTKLAALGCLFFAVLLSPSGFILAQQSSAAGAGGDGGKASQRGPDGLPDPRFRDRSNEPLETITGEVILLRRQGGAEGNPSGAPVITVRTETGDLIFHVGPPFFRTANRFPIAVGDVLVATGWRDKSLGYDALIVKTVKNGDKTLEVRNAGGERLWQRPDPADDDSPFESITGTVRGFGMKAHEAGGSVPDTGDNGIVLISTAQGDLYGHIGPASFRQAKGLSLAIGDRITLRAWRIDARMSNVPFVLARSVVDGDVDVEVRTDRRKALWK